MARDSKTKMSKKEINQKSKELPKNKKNHESSDDDDSNSIYTDDSENELDVHEYRKMLKKMFPSKHINKKIKAGEKLKQALHEKSDESEFTIEDDPDDSDYVPGESDEASSEEEIKKKSKKPPTKKIQEKSTQQKVSPIKKKQKKRVIVSSDDESEEELESLNSNEETNKSSKKFNIFFTIGGHSKEIDEDDCDDDEDEDWETCSDFGTENEDDPISSSDDSEDGDEEKEKEEEDEEEEEEYVIKTRSQAKQTGKQLNAKDVKKSTKKETNKRDDNNIITKLNEAFGLKKSESSADINDDGDLLKMLKDLQSRNKGNVLINECIRLCEEKTKDIQKKQEKKTKKEKARNNRIFKRLLRDKNTMNDFEFYEKLETVNQKKIIKELREINKISRIEKPYRLTLLESDIPIIFKSAAMKKISSLRYMEPGSGEYYKIKNWVDTFMRIPFSTYKMLPITITDGVEKCHDFMANAQKILDEAVYGLNDAKMQIMQMLGQLITNPKAVGSAIAIQGPMGTGKTTLVKEGISKILNRPFAFIALGGATDSSFLEGHGYTYEGSTWGKIVQILIDSKCMNPVIYFDELDKISDTPKGEEIAGILTHLTDTSQNSQFHDKYFAEIDFDLSKCLFIFSYNDESKVNPILRDRMYRIQTKGYSQKQKTVISNNYLLPKIREQVMFASEDIIIPDQTLQYIIEHHCNKEDGVRNLKRCLEIIYTKLNLYRLMRPDSNLFEEDMSLKVAFPFTVTKDIVDKLIKKSDGMNDSLRHLYI